MMLAVPQTEFYQQNFEFFFDKYLWKALWYSKAINGNDIFSLCIQKKHPSTIEQSSQSPQCRTFDFIVRIRNLVDKHKDYKYLKNQQVNFYYTITNRLIIPLKALMEEWNNSEMCKPCKRSHFNWNLHNFQQRFGNVINGEIQKEIGARMLLVTIDSFQLHLNQFEQTYECINRE